MEINVGWMIWGLLLVIGWYVMIISETLKDIAKSLKNPEDK